MFAHFTRRLLSGDSNEVPETAANTKWPHGMPWTRQTMSADNRRGIYHVAFILQQKLPPELVPPILDYAEYWIGRTVESSTSWDVTDSPGRGSMPGAAYISSGPIGADRWENVDKAIAVTGSHPVRKVVFTIESRDQGWSDYRDQHGTEEGSWSWFTVNVRERDEPTYQQIVDQWEETQGQAHAPDDRRGRRPEPREGRRVCNNVHAGKEWRTKVVEWRWDDEDEGVREWVRGLRRGQVIDLNVWARYQGWRNKVKSAKIEVYCAAVR